MNRAFVRNTRRAAWILVGMGLLAGGPAWAQPKDAILDQPGAGTAAATPPTSTSPASPAELRAYARKLWDAAKGGSEADVRLALDSVPAGSGALGDSVSALDQTLDAREKTRAEKIAEVEKKLSEKLADKESPKALSEAVKHAVEMYLLKTDKAGFMHEPRIIDLISRAETAAHEAETKQDWFLANELFYRLHVLMEESGRFKPDVERLSQRLSMMRMYVPESFWKMRNEQRLEEGKNALPPYNGLGEDYHDRLKGIDKSIVLQAIAAAERLHVDANSTGLKALLLSGLEAVKTMVTTPDLQAAFPALGEPAKRDLMVAFIDAQTNRLANPSTMLGRQTTVDLLDDMVDMNRKSVMIPDTALLHEFGNGVMGRLDDFSSIVWPDEVPRFDRMTSGVFRGVGVQIQVDDETQMIKVVTPLEGTPAQRAGIKAGDLIKKINGQSAVGITINQAVDLITGPENSAVTVVMEREGKELTFDLVRAVIDQPSVKGWKRSGVHEGDWNWFIDDGQQIGYLRMSGFQENTTGELRDAIAKMKAKGLRGLIVDLRFNPGGLLTEAVGVSNVFIDKGTIVSTSGVQGETKAAIPGRALLDGVPVVVLINEGSASASEIVSGAIRHYADKGQLDALLLGARSFGKGSVQNVWAIAPGGKAKMRLTTQYYMLPDGRIIHRKPGQSVWGVDPHLKIDMLPQQTSDALKLRQDADVLALNDAGEVVETKDHPEPEQLLTKNLDPQLQWALVLLEARAEAKDGGAAEHDQALRAQ